MSVRTSQAFQARSSRSFRRLSMPPAALALRRHAGASPFRACCAILIDCVACLAAQRTSSHSSCAAARPRRGSAQADPILPKASAALRRTHHLPSCNVTTVSGSAARTSPTSPRAWHTRSRLSPGPSPRHAAGARRERPRGVHVSYFPFLFLVEPLTMSPLLFITPTVVPAVTSRAFLSASRLVPAM